MWRITVLEGNEMSKTKRAFAVGAVCILTYIINYYLRNMLSVFTPELTGRGVFGEGQIALMSSTYMCFYAGGQLVNGFLGDVIAPKKMILAGLILAGGMTLLFPLLPSLAIAVVCFAIMGFALSMLRGPLMKMISESTEPSQARLICVFLSFASFSGPMIAGIFAVALEFDIAYFVAGGVAVLFAIASFITFAVMEKQGVIKYTIKERTKFDLSVITSVFKIEKIGFYLIVACLVEIGATTISFWIPTYLSAHLGFDEPTAAAIFTAISACRAFMPFVTLFIFNKTGENDRMMMRISFSVSAVFFIIGIFVTSPVPNVILLVIALMSMSCSSSLLWSIYIPGLGKTGKVSGVNGVLDCTGYIAAAVANLLFAFVMSSIGWSGVIILWASIGVIGVGATFIIKKTEA